MKADPKTGAITVSRVRDDGTPMPDRVIKGGTNELLATLNTFKDPTALYTFSQNEFNNNLKLEELDLNKKKADDLAKYYRDVAGSRGATGLKQKVADFKEVYGRDPTEEEKGVLAGLTTKAPNKPEADRDAWLKAEQKLIEADSSPEVIDAQRTAFFVRRGYAPAAARQVLEAGVNPATGKPLTRSDVDAYNATYPQTPVEPGSLPWLPSPEREARRQGLISQIPK